MNKITVIVPVYNGEKVIARAINSLLQQTVFVDILVIDDGSSDSTADIVKALAKDHDNLTYLLKENNGVSEARNFGIDHVKTEYFSFLDSDDYVREDMYEKMLTKIEETKSDICFSDFLWKFDDKEKVEKDTGYQNKHELLVGLFAVLWNKLYRTSWFKATGLRCPNVGSDEDSSLLYRLVYHMDKVCYVEEPFVYYVQHGASIKHTYNERVYGIIEVLEGIRSYYEEKGVYEEYKEEIEYLYIRYLFGNSYLSACRLSDKSMRKDALEKFWSLLNDTYPEYKKNRYLQGGGKKNAYFRKVNRTLYFSMAPVFAFFHRIGLMN